MTNTTRSRPLPPHGTYARSVGRPTSNIPGCACEPCVHARRAYKNRRGYLAGTGRSLTTNATPAAERLRYLRAKGATWKALIAATGCASSVIGDILNGSRTTIRATTARRILAVRLVDVLPRTGPLTGVGALRRLNALRALGWPLREIGARARIHEDTLAILTDHAQVAFRERIALVYDDLYDQDPLRYGIRKAAVTRIRGVARRNRWAPPSAWTDIDNDAKPGPRKNWRHDFTAPAQDARRQAVIEDTAELALHGVSRADLPGRLGITWEAITAAHRRAGVDLPLRLQLEHASEAATPQTRAA